MLNNSTMGNPQKYIYMAPSIQVFKIRLEMGIAVTSVVEPVESPMIENWETDDYFIQNQDL